MKRLPFVLALLIAALFGWLYLRTAPAVVNLDGLGYLKLLPHNFAAGHLAYMPILRTAVHLTGREPLLVGRSLNLLFGAAAIGLEFALLWRLLAGFRQRLFSSALGASGLGLSYGFWIQAADVEVYAISTLALLGLLHALLWYQRRTTLLVAVVASIALVFCVLCHLTHVLIVPLVAAALYVPRRQLGAVVIALLLGGGLCSAAYGYAAFVVRGHDPSQALHWIATSQHGFHQSDGVYRLADGMYGMAKALVYSPYLFESDAPRLLGQFLLGLLLLGLVIGLTIAYRKRLPHMAVFWGGLYVLPYAIFALGFFGSDSERWVFLLPLFWLLVGWLSEQLPLIHRSAPIAVFLLAAINLHTGIWPAHVDTWTRTRAEQVAQELHRGDLFIFPGHSWDEYVSFFAAAEIEPFPLSYYAPRDGLSACLARLEREIARTEQRGGRIVAARLFDERDDDPRGWQELRALGIPRASLLAQLGRVFSVTAQDLPYQQKLFVLTKR